MAHQPSSEDLELVRSLESFEIQPGHFDHRSHIRMAYTYLCEHDVQSACTKIRRVLCDFLLHNGIEPSTKYHETMTQVWTLTVRHFMDHTPNTTSSEQFIDANPKLLDSGILKTHYSKELLFSEEARDCFVEPDLVPIPR